MLVASSLPTASRDVRLGGRGYRRNVNTYGSVERVARSFLSEFTGTLAQGKDAKWTSELSKVGWVDSVRTRIARELVEGVA